MATKTVAERRAGGLYWDRAWKLVEGCTKCSPGCDNCWSETETNMRSQHPNEKINSRAIDVVGHCGLGFDGSITMRHDNLDLPLRIKKPTVFAIWNDLYHEGVDVDFILSAYDVMAKCPQHTFLVLTKRAERLQAFVEYMDNAGNDRFPENVYHGVTICNQAETDKNIPLLLQVPGKRFLSIEPMLGVIDLRLDRWVCSQCGDWTPDVYLTDDHHCDCDLYEEARYKNVIHQVLLGGESGKNARPMHPDWVRSVRDQCQAAGVPFMFKQWGEWIEDEQGEILLDRKSGMKVSAYADMVCADLLKYEPEDHTFMKRIGKKKAGRTLDGKLHDELIWNKEKQDGND